MYICFLNEQQIHKINILLSNLNDSNLQPMTGDLIK